MSRPYWSIKHVESMSLLPENLTAGRAYFIDDEQVIVINHGKGPVIYGGKPGPQGIPGEPIPILQSQIDNLSTAVLLINKTLYEQFERYDKTLATLTKTVSNLYPEHFNPSEQTENTDPLDGEVISTDAGIWKIEQTYLDDGSIILTLDAEQLYIDTIQEGDSVSYDGSSWTVDSKSIEGGMIILTLTR